MNFLNSAINETEKSSVLRGDWGFWELTKKCKCGFPLHLRSGSDLEFCPKCTEKKELAQQCRASLELAKAQKARREGRYLPTFYERAASAQRDEEQRGAFKFGMPL